MPTEPAGRGHAGRFGIGRGGRRPTPPTRRRAARRARGRRFRRAARRGPGTRSAEGRAHRRRPFPPCIRPPDDRRRLPTALRGTGHKPRPAGGARSTTTRRSIDSAAKRQLLVRSLPDVVGERAGIGPGQRAERQQADHEPDVGLPVGHPNHAVELIIAPSSDRPAARGAPLRAEWEGRRDLTRAAQPEYWTARASARASPKRRGARIAAGRGGSISKARPTRHTARLGSRRRHRGTTRRPARGAEGGRRDPKTRAATHAGSAGAAAVPPCGPSRGPRVAPSSTARFPARRCDEPHDAPPDRTAAAGESLREARRPRPDGVPNRPTGSLYPFPPAVLVSRAGPGPA